MICYTDAKIGEQNMKISLEHDLLIQIRECWDPLDET